MNRNIHTTCKCGGKITNEYVDIKDTEGRLKDRKCKTCAKKKKFPENVGMEEYAWKTEE